MLPVPVLLLPGAAKYRFASPDGSVGDAKLNAQGAHGWSADGRSFVCGVHYWFNRRLALIRSSYVV
jgi:hypothetical protein